MGSRVEMSDAHEHAAQLIPWLINGTLGAEEAASLRAHLEVCASCRADFDSEQRLYEAVRGDGVLVFSGEPSFQKLMARIEADDFAATEAPSVAGAAPPISGEDAAGRASGAAASQPAPSLPEEAAGRQPGAARARPWSRTAPRRRSARRRLWGSPVVVRWLAAAALIEAVGLGLGAWAWQTHGPAAPVHPLTASVSRAEAAPYAEEAAPYRTLTTLAPSYATGPRVRVVFRPRLSLEQLQRLLRSVGAHIVDGPTEAHVYTLGFGKPMASVEELHERIASLRADPNVLFAEPAEVRPP